MSIRVWSGVTIGPTGQKLKQIIDAYPGDKSGLYVTSGFRSGDRGHHGGLTYGGSNTAALDIGFGYGTSGYQKRARDFAAWLYQFSGDTVELIVSKVGSSNANGGYYVKNQRRVAPYAHTGSNPSVRHENHVHFATSSALADRILAKIRAGGGGSAPSPPPSSPGASQAQISTTPWTERPVIRRGDSGGAVGHAQFLLRNRLGYTIDTVSGSPFGPQTEQAVRHFQGRYAHLTVDGVIGPATWPQLEVAAAKAISTSNRPVIRRGSEGVWTGYAQHALRKAGHRIDDVNGFPFGPQTESAVRAEQQKWSWLTVDGVVGPQTWPVLDAIEAGRTPSNPGGSSPPSSPSPPPSEPSPPSGADYSAPDSFVTREEWGAHPAKSASSVSLDYWKGITIHHTAGQYSPVKNIQEWMMFNRPNEADRLADIGYSFLIRDGKVHVGRGFHVRPAHDGINTTIGLCVIGSYGSTLPSREDREAVVFAVKEIEKYVGRKLTVDKHRDRRQTSCPGDRFSRWIDNDLPGLLKESTPTPPPAPPEPPKDRVKELVDELIKLLKEFRDAT